MKSKILTVFITLLLAAALFAGCSKASPSPSIAGSGQGAVTIAASFYPIYIMLMNITANMPDVRIVDMTQPTTGCLHDYSVTPDDMVNLEGARFLVINGAGMESFMDKVVAQFPDLKTIDSSININLIQGKGDEAPNPHIWVSISNAIQQVKNIAEQLSGLDAAHAAQYTANADIYVKKLEVERDKMHRALDGLPMRDIVTFHEAFPYFAREFNLNIVGVIEREPGSEPSARELAATIDTINVLHVHSLFAEPQYPVTAADSIAQETGLRVYTLDPAVTGPMDPDAYLDIMDSNLKVLEEALQ